MAQLLREGLKFYNFLFEELPNPMVKDWFLMSSPWPGIAILVGYLYFVKKCGPKWMENREPFKLDRLIQIYNVIQIFIAAYTTYKGMKYGYGMFGWGGNYSYLCEPMDWSDNYSAVQITSMTHMYFVTKVIDLLDTVFFILRKKQNQITFLHVYHHAGMVALAWGGTKWLSNGHCVMLFILNSAVHTIMYTYYLITSLSDTYKKSIWWKKYITKIQIAQFCYLAFHFGQIVFNNPCNFPTFPLLILIPQNFFMLVLFLDFYFKAYHSKKKPNKTS